MAKPTIKQQIKETAQLKKQMDEITKTFETNQKLTAAQTKSMKEQFEQLKKDKDILTKTVNDRLRETTLGKIQAKARQNATKQTREIYTQQKNTTALKALETVQGKKAKITVESMIKDTAAIASLHKESQISSYDQEETLEQIANYEDDIAKLKGKDYTVAKNRLDNLKLMNESMVEQQAIQEVSAENWDTILGGLNMSKTALKGMVAGAKKFMIALMANPISFIATLLVSIVALIVKAGKHVRGVSEEFGVSFKNAGKLAFEMAKVNPLLRAADVDIQKLGGSLFDTFKTLGAVTTENMNKLGFLNLKFGVTSDTAAGLAQIVQRELGGSIGENIDRVSDFARQFSEAGVGAEAALADMQNNAKFLYEYMGGSVDQFVKATIQARKLGLNLSTVANIADSLLDFETSIANTMNASLLIGRQLNFDRARGLALEGDTLGAVQDITKQLGGVAEFQKLNVLQRRGLAEALGVGTDELSALIRGEAVELKSDPVIQSQGKLIEAINSNTVAQKGEDFLKSRQDNKKLNDGMDQLNQNMVNLANSSNQTANNTKPLKTSLSS